MRSSRVIEIGTNRWIISLRFSPSACEYSRGGEPFSLYSGKSTSFTLTLHPIVRLGCRRGSPFTNKCTSDVFPEPAFEQTPIQDSFGQNSTTANTSLRSVSLHPSHTVRPMETSHESNVFTLESTTKFLESLTKVVNLNTLVV
jgi:hypothetical protein